MYKLYQLKEAIKEDKEIGQSTFVIEMGRAIENPEYLDYLQIFMDNTMSEYSHKVLGKAWIHKDYELIDFEATIPKLKRRVEKERRGLNRKKLAAQKKSELPRDPNFIVGRRY